MLIRSRRDEQTHDHVGDGTTPWAKHQQQQVHASSELDPSMIDAVLPRCSVLVWLGQSHFTLSFITDQLQMQVKHVGAKGKPPPFPPKLHYPGWPFGHREAWVHLKLLCIKLPNGVVFSFLFFSSKA